MKNEPDPKHCNTDVNCQILAGKDEEGRRTVWGRERNSKEKETFNKATIKIDKDYFNSAIFICNSIVNKLYPNFISTIHTLVCNKSAVGRPVCNKSVNDRPDCNKSVYGRPDFNKSVNDRPVCIL